MQSPLGIRDSTRLEKQLAFRGYPGHAIQQARARVKQINQFYLLKDKSRAEQGKLACTLQYTGLANPIKCSIYKHWHITADVLGCSTPPIIGY